QGLYNNFGDDQARKPLMVRRHDVPRRAVSGGVTDHVLVGAHVTGPMLPFFEIGLRKLPVFLWFREPAQEAFALLLPGDVQKEFADGDTAPSQMLLEGVDVFEAFAPDTVSYKLNGHFFLNEQLGVHSHY